MSKWTLSYQGWDPEAQPLREALTTLGNGHFATRGAAEEVQAEAPHYPGTYLVGGYNRLESEVAGRVVENEDLVNWPNWLALSFRCEDENWLNLGNSEILEYSQELDLRRGVLSRRLRFRDHINREFSLTSRRIVHMDDANLAAIEWVVTPLNWSGNIEIRSAVDGRVSNSGVARYRELASRHLQAVASGSSGESTVYLVSKTNQSHIEVAQAIRTCAYTNQAAAAAERHSETRKGWASQHLFVHCEKGKPLHVEKVMALYSSRDFAISEPRVEACDHVHHAGGFEQLLQRHELAWNKLWHRADLELIGQEVPYAQLALRLHIFHILQTASMNTIGRDVGIPARGIHGEAYRGHIFWDELFTFPFLNLRIPELTRALLLYRYRRLKQARFAAQKAGYKGAMFPWQSGSNGREETQELHLNPKSGRWLPDNTHRQRHVNSAIAYNVWQYYQATGDMEFLSFYGAELLLEISRFWASIASYSASKQRYEIRGVVGPDEFHTRYPGTQSAGLNNNAYTNVMAAWVLQTTQVALGLLAEDRRGELLATLQITDEDLRRWDEISRRMYVPYHDTDIISQFEGWDDLEELDWNRLRTTYGNIHRLDRLLEAEGDDPNRYKASKQADVLMLFFLFSAEELKATFERLEYPFNPECIPRNVEYYLARTSDGSTLSSVVHAWVLARTDRKSSWRVFYDALASDIDDVQGGTTPEGVHLGAMGGTVDLMQRCYTGIEMRDGVLWLNPLLPDDLPGLRLTIRYQGHWLGLHITQQAMDIAFEKGSAGPARIGFRNEVFEMKQGETRHLSLEKSP